MPTIRPADIRTMMQQLAADGRLDRADVDKLVDAAMQDKLLSLGEKAELTALIAEHADKFDSPETRQRLESFLGLSDGGVRALAHQLERDDGVIGVADADKLAALVDRDGRFKSEAKFSLRGLMVGAKMSDEARTKIGAVAARADETPPALVEKTNTPVLAIPDNQAAGVTDSMRFSEPGSVGDVRVELDLDHTYRGDLRVSLIAPDGTEVKLHDKKGSSADDLIGVYPIDIAPAQSLDALKGKPIAGDWKLKVVDTAGQDVGTLNSWRLAFTPAATPPPPPTGTTIEKASAPNVAIPDNKPQGIQDKVSIAEAATVDGIAVELDLDHTYRGDLVVSLIGPDGTAVTLHDRQGGSSDHLKGSYPGTLTPAQSLDAFKGKSAQGDWTLKVVDTAGQDVGTLKNWKLTVKTAGTPPPAGDAIDLGQTKAERPVFLSSSGFFVEDKALGRPANNIELGSGLFRAAELVDDKRSNPIADANLPLAARQTVLQNLQQALALVAAGGSRPADLNEMQALQLRSSSLTVLLALCESAGTSGGELTLKQAAFDAYTGALRAETNPTLRDSLIFNLHAITPRLPAAMKTVSDELTNEIAPLAPPYDEWFKDGNNTLNIFWASGEGSEGFYAGTVELLKKQGFAVEGTERPGGPNILAKSFTNRNGQEVKVRITTHLNRNDIFDKMNDPSFQIVGYDGHSDIGRAIPASLRRAPASDGKKLIFYGLCAGKDNLHRVRDKYPDAQILTSFTSSYFNTEDLPGGGKRMNRSENFNALMELVKGAVERHPWTTINKNIRDNAILFPWSHVMPGGTNYLSPIHTMLRRRALDSDHDGQADALDKLCTFDTFKVAEDTRREFTPVDAGRPAATLDGSRAHLAAMALNTATGYNEVTQDWKKGNIIGDGYFEPRAGDKAIVKFERDTVDGQPVLYLSVNARYAHMSTEALRAIANYQFIMDSAARGGNPTDPVDRKLMALTFAAFSIMYDESMWGRDDEIWSNLLAANNLPADIPFAPLQALLDEEHHDYSGNLTHVRKWKESIPAAALEALKRSDVGVP